MELLLNRGAMMNPPLLFGQETQQQEIPSTPLHQACAYNCIDTTTLFLDRGAAPNWLIKGRGPLHFAITNKAPDLKFFEFLIKQGADVNLQVTPAAETPVLLLLNEGLTPIKCLFFDSYWIMALHWTTLLQGIIHCKPF